MASPTLTYNLTNGTTANADEVMQDFNDLLNGITDGTKDLSIAALTVAGTATLNGNTTIGNSASDTLTITATPAAFPLTGIVTGAAAGAGIVGQVLRAENTGSAVTANTTSDITSVALTAGSWDVSGVGGITRSGGGTLTHLWTYISVSLVSATRGVDESIIDGSLVADVVKHSCGPLRVDVSSLTTVYLVGFVNFSGTTASKVGTIRAVRVR